MNGVRTFERSNVSTFKPPHCPLHLSTEMVLLEMRMPRFAWETEEQQETRKKTREVWKCPVASCPRIALCEEPPEIDHRCPTCHEITDAKRGNCDHRCYACKRKYDRARRARLAARGYEPPNVHTFKRSNISTAGAA